MRMNCIKLVVIGIGVVLRIETQKVF
jgi:hypothetical protein